MVSITRSILVSLSGLAVVAAVATTADEPESPAYRYKIAYATYLGGGRGEQLREVIPGADGSVLVGGQTSSNDLPTTPGVVQRRYGGEEPPTGHGGIVGGDCFLARLGPAGTKLVFCTYFGGSKQERNVYGMALDSKGNIVITSATRSPDLPTTPGAFQRKYGGPPSDWMVAKLSPDCQKLLWCTYVGGNGGDSPRGGLGLDRHDNVYVVGGTASGNFPTTPGAFQRRRKGDRDAAVVKLKPDGSGLVFGTLLGGGGWDGTMGVRVDGSGNVYVAGHTRSKDFPATDGAPQAKLGGRTDACFAKLSPDGGKLLQATFLGGGQQEFAEHRPWLGPDGSVMLAGVTGSSDFPTTPKAFQRKLKGRTDGFLTKLSADAKKFVFSSLLGGSGGEFYLMPTPDAKGNIFIVGHTSSRDFPVTAGALQGKYGGGGGDGVLAVLSADGARLLYATYLGGGGDDLIRSIAIGPKGEVYLVGSTSSKDFPVTAGAFQRRLAGGSDAFVVKLMPGK